MVIISFRRPSLERLRRFVAEQSELHFTYPDVGATSRMPPAGYVLDRTRIELGVGEAVFESAKAALRHWEHFRLGWVEAWPPQTPLESGQAVAVMVRSNGLWWTNACRIIYSVDESKPLTRFGFAYGTLPGHVESGEERFQVEWDRETNRVFYDILAFSKPSHIMARLGYPFVRRIQKQFGRSSATAVFKAIHGDAPIPEIFQSSNSKGP